MAHKRTTFFTIDRKLLESPEWLSEPFTRAQAWVDLIGRANYSDVQKIDGTKVITIRRGQVVTSEVALAQRWKWNRKKVRAYLSALEELGQISKKHTAKGTVLTLENYDFYQTKGTAKGTAQGQLRVQQRDSSGYTQKQREQREQREQSKEREARARAYGPNGRLTLTNEEAETLKRLYPVDFERFVEELDEYKGATGKEYVNDFDAFKRWAKQDVRFNGKGGEVSSKPRYKSGLEKVMEEIENGTFIL